MKMGPRNREENARASSKSDSSWTLALIDQLTQAGIFLTLDGGHFRAYGPNAALERFAGLIRDNRERLHNYLRARFALDRLSEREALRSFCREDCPDLSAFTLANDNGPAWQCLHPGGWRLHTMTTCPKGHRQENQP